MGTFGGNFKGEVYVGGRVVGEECCEIKKKNLWVIFFGGGGDFWGKVKKRCGGTWGVQILF